MIDDVDKRSTKERILDAALLAFAERGFGGVSMRQILSDAGTNVAAGHYHFGSKQALYTQVVLRYMLPLNQARFANLEELKSLNEADRHIRLVKFVRAYIEPHVNFVIAKGGAPYGTLITRFLVESASVTQTIYREAVYPLRIGFTPYLTSIAPDLSDERKAQCFELMALTMSAFAVRLEARALNEASAERELHNLIEFLAGGLEAYIDS